MGMTMTQKILAAHAGLAEVVEVKSYFLRIVFIN